MASGDFGPTATGAASGAGTGAMIGSMFPGPGTAIGAGIGALGGGLMGFFGSKGANDAAAAQRKAIDAAMARLQAFSQEQYKNRMDDLNKTMSFYGPVQQQLSALYGNSPQGKMPMQGGAMPSMPGLGGGMPGGKLGGRY